MNVEQGGTTQTELSPKPPVINRELLENLYANKASLLDGITSELSAEELERIYDQIGEFGRALSDQHSHEGFQWGTPKFSEYQEQRKQDANFINQIEAQISRDFLQTHGLAQTVKTYQKLGDRSVHYETAIVESDLLTEISHHLQNGTRAEIYQGLNQLPINDKLDLLRTLATEQTLDSDRGHEQDFKNLAEMVSAQDNSPFADFIIKYCKNLNEELRQSKSTEQKGYYSEFGNSLRNARTWSSHENNSITNAVRPDEPMQKGENIVHIAKNALGIITPDGTPRAYVYISKKEIRDKQEIKLNTLNGFIQLYSPWDGYQKDIKNFSIHENMDDLEELAWHIMDINSQFVCAFYKIEPNDFKSLAEVWHEISPVMSAAEWGNFLRQAESYSDDARENQSFIGEDKYKELVSVLNEKINPEYTKDTRNWLENIRSAIEAKIPQVHFQNYKDLAKDHAVNPFDKTEDGLAVYFSFLHNPVFQIKIEQELNIDLTEIDLNSQIHLLRFLIHADSKTYERFTEITKYKGRSKPISYNQEFRDNFLKSFLTCADDLEFGKKLIGLYERQEVQKEETQPNGVKFVEYNQKSLPAIFAKYAEIVDAAENVRSYLQENYHGDADSEQTIELIMQNLLRKGKDLLTDFADSPREPEEILEKLEIYRSEIVLDAITFKAIKTAYPETRLEDLSVNHVEVAKGTEFTPADQDELRRILKSNWDKPEFATIYPILAQNMEESFANPDMRYHLVRFVSPDGNASTFLTFQRFEEIMPGVVYASGNNVHPGAQYQSIGTAAQQEILGAEVRENIVIADAYLKIRVIGHYLNRSGFTAAGVYRDFHGTGEPYFCMVDDKMANDSGKYIWRNFSPEQIISAYEQNQFSSNTTILKVEVGQLFSENADQNQISSQLDNALVEELNPYFQRGLIITALARDPNNQSIIYFAFEPNQSDISVEITDNKLHVVDSREQELDRAA